MVFRASIDSQGLRKKLKALKEQLDDPTELYQRVAEAIKEEIDRAFQKEQSPFGKPWAKHSPVTINVSGEHPILDQSGKLKNSIDISVGQEGIKIVVGAPYGKVHQFGAPGNKPWGKQGSAPIPQRQYLPFEGNTMSEDLAKKLEVVLQEWADETLGEGDIL